MSLPEDREPAYTCEKCLTCDKRCDEHSSVADFKTGTEKVIGDIFSTFDKIIPELARTTTYVKIGGTIACLLLLALCVMTGSSYVRLNEFIISHGESEAAQAIMRANMQSDIEHNGEMIRELKEDVKELGE